MRDGKNYYSYDEMINVTDTMIEENAKKFAKKVMQKRKMKLQEVSYV